ncbi:hypothetical protein KAR91_38310 [Candidatus Pacearchaeota archaeon]|nr:hypothetical protein [Candidatus Pacearchaeota archaeon]
MCDCINEYSEKITEKAKPDLEKTTGFVGIVQSGFVNEIYVDMDSSTTKVPLLIPFEIEYERRAKSSGNIRTCTKKISFIPSFCPICGEKYD